MPITLEIFDDADLTGIHALGSIVGIVLSATALQLTQHDAESRRDGTWLNLLRRAAYGCIGIAMAWGYLYSYSKGWQLWPSHLFFILSVDMLLTARVIALVRHLYFDGTRNTVNKYQ